jgi:hypothetical protein
VTKTATILQNKFSGSKHSLYQGEVEGESVYPKKVAHKKKGNKKHNVNLDSFEDQHSKTLGKGSVYNFTQRGEEGDKPCNLPRDKG